MVGLPVARDADVYRECVSRINALEPELRDLADEELEIGAQRLHARAAAGAEADELREELFAIAREASRRLLGLRPYDEQIVAGLALSDGRVIEMQTGEGKTLAAVAPAALAAMAGRRVHVLTFNDYLARRDAAWMGPVYRFLGLEVGCVQEGMSPGEKRRAYGCDLCYLTAKEAGFDFLRGFLCLEPEELIDRSADFALVDEADSILIDEARIPLVIAGSVEEQSTAAEQMAAIARELRPAIDFDTDEHAFNIFLTDRGSARVEGTLGCDNLYDEANLPLLAELRNALHAEHLLERDVDYIVRSGRVELVDELTGRVADKRQWPDGLQAAIEAKERLKLREEGRILGSITIQHFLRSYPKLAGMTATARSAADELEQFYGLELVVIPSHRPDCRVDHPDSVFTHREPKLRALVAEIERVHRSGRPILVGTASVAESEELAAELGRRGVSCHVLNAKNDEVEAEIVAGAGSLGAVTISTNMAGRGTDIRLGGADERERDRVVELGGLYLIGTNRHASLRIDRQLRGRAGRQGDPGSSRFFISLEDPLIARYGVKNLIAARHLPESQQEAVDAPILRREIARAQRIIEGEDFDIRRRLWRYAEPIEWQRRQLQAWRQDILLDRHPPETLAARSAERYRAVTRSIGEEAVLAIEKRLTLLITDRCWSDHLAELRRIQDGIHVVQFAGKDSLGEFFRESGRAFSELRASIDDEIVAAFDRIEITEKGVDWQKEGLIGPSSTWTYLVSDNPFGNNPMMNLASRAGAAAVGSFLVGPLIFLWGLLEHRRRKKARAKLEAEEDET
jgi:preprotein translocase subunit SecA